MAKWLIACKAELRRNSILLVCHAAEPRSTKSQAPNSKQIQITKSECPKRSNQEKSAGFSLAEIDSDSYGLNP
jgi:hypothetical protein